MTGRIMSYVDSGWVECENVCIILPDYTDQIDKPSVLRHVNSGAPYSQLVFTTDA